MNRLRFLMTAFVYVGSLVYVQAQAHPDFSGLWKQNMGESSKTSLQSYANRIEQKRDALKVTTTTGGSRGERSYDRTYVIGKESQTVDKEGDQFTSLVKWEGQALVFLTTEKERTGTIDTRETWTLSADGKTLTKVRRSQGSRGETEQRYILEKSLD
jgi:hypothetical protein